jgi:hypothetical protein
LALFPVGVLWWLVKYVKGQAMRGSALRGPGEPVPLAAPRDLAGAGGPVHPLPHHEDRKSHGSENRARTKHITIRLTPDERITIDGSAERAGLTSGSYARQILLGAPAPRQVRRPPIERRELARLLGELGSIGNNINQLARAANSGDAIDSSEFNRAMGWLREMRDAVLQALGRDL